MSPIKKNKRFFLITILVFNMSFLFAQQTFKYQAVLPKVETDGFYQIHLQPSLIAKSSKSFADIRILNHKKRFSPYIFGNRLVLNNQTSFIVFPKLKSLNEADTITSFIAENKARLTINQLVLALRNIAVIRTVNLSGSDDLKKWYAIKENILLQEAASGDQNNGTYQQQLNFPSSTYRYLKVEINNGKKESVAILQAGIYKQQTVKPNYVKLDDPVITQKDSGSVSRITIKFNDNYQINKLHLTLGGQKYYKRNIRLYDVGKHSKTSVIDTVISSLLVPELYLSVKTNMIELLITNGDNPPLVINNVTAYQLDQSLISYLEKDQEYHILFGDDQAAAPDYDLKFFADSLQQDLKQITPAAISPNPLYQPVITKKQQPVKNDFLPAWVIWLAIAAAAAVLIFLTFRMTQEVKKREEEKKE